LCNSIPLLLILGLQLAYALLVRTLILFRIVNNAIDCGN